MFWSILKLIGLTLLWTVGSTMLVLPWFWKGMIKRKTFVGDETHVGATKDKYGISVLIPQAIFIIVIIAASLISFLVVKSTITFYGSGFSVICAIISQIIIVPCTTSKKKWQKCLAWFLVLIVCISIFAVNSKTDNKPILGYDVKTEAPVSVYIDGEEEPVPSKDTIAYVYNTNSCYGPYYSNGNFLYTVRTITGDGVVVISREHGETSYLISCDHVFSNTSLKMRLMFPSNFIQREQVVISNEGIPYVKYLILGKNNIFSPRYVEKVLLKNCITGEFSVYIPEDLPKFAK